MIKKYKMHTYIHTTRQKLPADKIRLNKALKHHLLGELENTSAAFPARVRELVRELIGEYRLSKRYRNRGMYSTVQKHNTHRLLQDAVGQMSS
jgi:hypothetical protein